MKIQGLRGTRDFYPSLMRELNYIFKIWRVVSERFGYEEFDGPMIEPALLYKKSGAEIPEQMYRFKDKSDEELAVRPELTPTLARMVTAKQKEFVKPIKWYSISRSLRYEAPQSGRLREFFQYNVDCLGTDSMKSDAEVIAVGINVLLELKCNKEDFYIRISNRKLASSLISSLGVKEGSLKELSRLIDKYDKLSDIEFVKGLKDLGLNEKQISKLKGYISLKSIKKIDIKNLDENGKKGLEELNQLFSYLEAYGLTEYVEFDFSIMRGFDYYTSTVFEIFDRKKEFRAIAGGGRYDDLVKDFGGEPCSGIGFGMGDVVLGLLLKKLGKFPELTIDVDYFIAPVSDDVYPKAAEIASTLRKKYNVSIDVTGRGLSKLIDYANTIKVKNLVIVGKKDLDTGVVTVRDMNSGTEKKVKLESISKI